MCIFIWKSKKNYIFNCKQCPHIFHLKQTQKSEEKGWHSHDIVTHLFVFSNLFFWNKRVLRFPEKTHTDDGPPRGWWSRRDWVPQARTLCSERGCALGPLNTPYIWKAETWAVGTTEGGEALCLSALDRVRVPTGAAGCRGWLCKVIAYDGSHATGKHHAGICWRRGVCEGYAGTPLPGCRPADRTGHAHRHNDAKNCSQDELPESLKFCGTGCALLKNTGSSLDAQWE